jgi:hypothetical protein
MNIFGIILCVSLLGAVGGLVNCIIHGFEPPVWKGPSVRLGWFGNLVTGASAALVIWGIYGPLASYDLISGKETEIHCTVAQLLGSLIVGLSGGSILTLIAQTRVDHITKEVLGKALDSTLEEVVQQKER